MDALTQSPPRRQAVQSVTRAVAVVPRREIPFGLGIASFSFLLCVLLPTLMAVLYLMFVRSPEYVSEAKFVIRTGSDDLVSRFSLDKLAVPSLLTGMKNSSQDTHIVLAYLRSRNAIEDVGGRALLEKFYARGDIDYFSRLRSGDSLEDMWKYWRTRVSAVLDVPSGIVTLEVRAFRREDANILASKLLVVGERLVNEISERARKDTLEQAQADLDKARHEAERRRAEVASFRQQNEVLDPATTASSIADLIAKLLKEKLALEAQLSTVGKTLAEESSTVRSLRTRLATLDDQMRKLEAQLTSSGNERRVVAKQLAEYDQAQLELKFAEKLYEIAEASYQKALSDLQRQQLYLITLLRPSRPEDKTYPRPVTDGFLVFVWLSALWSVVALTIAGILEHR